MRGCLHRSDIGLVLAAGELAVDKVLAIFGRAEARNFVDLAALEPRFGLIHLCDLAEVKDIGFSRTVFVEMLDRFNRLDRDEFDVNDIRHAATVDSVRRWRVLLGDTGLIRPATRCLTVVPAVVVAILAQSPSWLRFVEDNPGAQREPASRAAAEHSVPVCQPRGLVMIGHLERGMRSPHTSRYLEGGVAGEHVEVSVGMQHRHGLPQRHHCD